MTGMVLERVREEEEVCALARELRNDPKVMEAFSRGLEARRSGDRIHWNDVKSELGIQ